MRRLADELIDTSRPLLFENWKSAPRKLKIAVKWTNGNGFDRLKPRCDKEILSKALLHNTLWFDRLRENDGVRDVLTHQPHILQIGPQGTAKSRGMPINWRITATLTQGMPGDNFRHRQLLPILLDCIDGACNFMKLLCQSVGLGDGYQPGDSRFLIGYVNDGVGFWPPISGQRDSFPIMD